MKYIITIFMLPMLAIAAGRAFAEFSDPASSLLGGGNQDQVKVNPKESWSSNLDLGANSQPPQFGKAARGASSVSADVPASPSTNPATAEFDASDRGLAESLGEYPLLGAAAGLGGLGIAVLFCRMVFQRRRQSHRGQLQRHQAFLAVSAATTAKAAAMKEAVRANAEEDAERRAA